MTAPSLGKPRLGSRPVNEGQRRLLWWLIGETDRATRDTRAVHLRQSGVSDWMRDRLIAGEIVPTGAVAVQIIRATGGAVDVRDWTDKPAGAWGDWPAARPLPRAAA